MTSLIFLEEKNIDIYNFEIFVMLIDKTYNHMKHFEKDKTERKNSSNNKKCITKMKDIWHIKLFMWSFIELENIMQKSDKHKSITIRPS